MTPHPAGLLRDPLTGLEWVRAVPGRRLKPSAADVARMTRCAFCPPDWATQPGAHLQQTPFGPVACHDNPWPVSDLGHRVLLPTRAHQELPERVTAAQWSAALAAGLDTFGEGVWPLVAANLGPASGASVPHLHLQALALPEPAPACRREAAPLRDGACQLCAPPDYYEQIPANEGVNLLVPAHGGEVLVAPSGHGGHPDRLGLEQAGLALERVWAAFAGHGHADGQLALHHAPGDFHWHLHVTPMAAPAGCLERFGALGISRHEPTRLIASLRETLA